MDVNYDYWGVDVSKDNLQIATQAQKGTWSDSKIPNEIEAINTWLDGSLTMFNPFVILEYTGTYSARLVYCLQLRGIPFCLLTASQSSGFSKTLQNINKTDKADARNLFVYGQKMKPEQTSLPGDDAMQKKELFKHLSSLKEEKRRFENRLHALDFNPKANSVVVRSVEKSIEFFDQQIQELEADLFKGNDTDFDEMNKNILKIVGIGPKSAAAILTATNGFANFDNVKQVAKFLGICPSSRQSGSSVKGKSSIPKSANAYVRQCLYMGARSAIIHNNACKALYERLRNKGKCYRVAMIAVVHKLLKQTFWVAKNKGQFDNQFGLAK